MRFCAGHVFGADTYFSGGNTSTYGDGSLAIAGTTDLVASDPRLNEWLSTSAAKGAGKGKDAADHSQVLAQIADDPAFNDWLCTSHAKGVRKGALSLVD